jgi:hypothetical protein
MLEVLLQEALRLKEKYFGFVEKNGFEFEPRPQEELLEMGSNAPLSDLIEAFPWPKRLFAQRDLKESNARYDLALAFRPSEFARKELPRLGVQTLGDLVKFNREEVMERCSFPNRSIKWFDWILFRFGLEFKN